MTVDVADSWTIVHGAPGTIWPTLMRSIYVGIWMMPCESWPARFASTEWRMTISASSSGDPAATSSALPIWCSCSAGTWGMGGGDVTRRRTEFAGAVVLEHEHPDGH